MPYSGASDPGLPANVKKMPAKKKRQWVHVFNSAYAACMKDKSDQKACEASAFKQANGVAKNNILEIILDKLGLIKEEDRSISMPMVYSNVDKAIRVNTDKWEWLIDVYYDDGSLFAITAMEGALYRRPIDIDENDEVSVGEATAVKAEFVDKPSTRMQLRQVGDKVRWFLITGTTVLNRNGFIDSSELYDNMIRRCEETGEYPVLDFCHLGNDYPEFIIGTCDWLARDGVVTLASGFLSESPIARAMQKAWTADPEYWGSSIAFYPTVPQKMVEVAEDIKIPVYTDGIFHMITVLPEKDACSLFTAMQIREEKEKVMEARILEALKKLAGDDEKLLEEFVSKVDGVNERVKDENLISRSVEPAPATAPEMPAPEAPAPAAEITQEIFLTPDAILQIFQAEAFQKVVKQLTALEGAILDITKKISDTEQSMAVVQQELKQRVAVVERSDEQKREAWDNDLPRNQSRPRIILRPSRPEPEPKSDENKRESYRDVAAATIALLKD